ncbi:MAG TPA: alpha/beta hydrolase [Streptosporangiaceae bacterium]|nr:alpha/beta hydrolase [Streptosporangiaceae bacterium]
MALAEPEEPRVMVAGGSIPIRILPSPGPCAAVIVYLHGGGWVHGGLDESEPVARALARHCRCTVVSVGYRLAPAYRYPTAVEDAWLSLCWVDDHLEEIAGQRLPLIVAGEDAGGNLAAVVARRAASGGPAVALQILIGPITDADFDSLSYLDPANQSSLDRDAMIAYWNHYAPDIRSRSDPDASPLQTVFLSGLPPAVILTAEHDVLRDDGELYATRLVQAGVQVEHRRFTGQQHGFFGQFDDAGRSASQDGLDYVAGAVARRLAALSETPSRRPH